MNKKKLGFWLCMMLFALLLAACSSAPFDSAYTAAGDGTEPDDLARTSVFRPDDDLNIVVKLNSHNREIPVQAVFTAPTGTTYQTDPFDVSETAGEVVLGLDWEGNTGGEPWPVGEWSVAVFVDEKQEKMLTFQVEAEASETSG